MQNSGSFLACRRMQFNNSSVVVFENCVWPAGLVAHVCNVLHMSAILASGRVARAPASLILGSMCTSGICIVVSSFTNVANLKAFSMACPVDPPAVPSKLSSLSLVVGCCCSGISNACASALAFGVLAVSGTTLVIFNLAKNEATSLDFFSFSTAALCSPVSSGSSGSAAGAGGIGGGARPGGGPGGGRPSSIGITGGGGGGGGGAIIGGAICGWCMTCTMCM
mmetsp:Transcript_14976/g.32465  ORF Transcript_14976/g.32465 Transcript_14976/m.32465 type:complete len:223 (-) Transcript_14976:902-1570(-)